MSLVTNKVQDLKPLLEKHDAKLYEFDTNICCDLSLSQLYFDEFKDNASGKCEVQEVGSQESTYVLYGNDIEPSDTFFKEWRLQKMRKSELLGLCYNMSYYHFDENDKKQDMIDDLLLISYEDYYNEYFHNINWREQEDYAFDVRGYSQGHIVRIVKVGNVPKFMTRDYLQNIFFDAPIYGRIDINCNGEQVGEIYIDEYLDNLYEWDKDKVIERISEAYKNEDYIEFLKKELDNLPSELDYTF